MGQLHNGRNEGGGADRQECMDEDGIRVVAKGGQCDPEDEGVAAKRMMGDEEGGEEIAY